MPQPYESSRRRGGWGPWVPLVLTVTAATVGVAAWLWSQQKEDEEDVRDLDYNTDSSSDISRYGESSRELSDIKEPLADDEEERLLSQQSQGSPTTTWAALRRTPSPQHFFDSAKRTVAAGMTAVGSALASIREEDRRDYADHETWSEVADARKEKERVVPTTPAATTSQPTKEANKRRKKVAIIVSADTQLDHSDVDGFLEHASILSHIPRLTYPSQYKLYILIYAPNLKDTALDASGTLNHPPASLSSSFSAIEHPQAGDEAKSPLVGPSSPNPAFNAIYSQAQSLVEKESMILTFTTPQGHAYILRHIQPEIIYLQESLAGENGSVVSQLQTWLRHDIVLVVGADSAHGGGLVDSESEVEKTKQKKKDGKEVVWWQREERVGRGRGVIVVDVSRVHDDWVRRVLGRE